MDVTPKNGVKDSVTDRNAEGDLKFQGKTLQDLLFVEIFAGTARLSKVAREQGIGILPVDKTSERASQIFVANYDVTNPEEFHDLMALLETEKDCWLSTLRRLAAQLQRPERRNFGTSGTKGSRYLDLLGQKKSLWAWIAWQVWTKYERKLPTWFTQRPRPS